MKIEEKQQTKKRKKKVVIILIITIICILLLFSIAMFIKQNTANNQIKEFNSAVKNNDYSRISSILSNNNNSISKKEAKEFVKYVKKEENSKRYQKEVIKIKQAIKNNDEVQKGKITDKSGKTLIDVRQNGKKLLIFDQIKLVPHKYNVYVKEYDNKATYQYKLGKNIETDAGANKKSLIGRLFVGSYIIDSKKTIKHSFNNGEVNGQLIVNTEKKDENNKVIAEDNFNQSWFKVNLKNQDKLDKNSLKIHVNYKTQEYKDGKIYGKLANREDVKVFATGSIHGKYFKTNINSLNKNDDTNTQNVKLKFDKDKIEDYLEKYNKIKGKSKTFIKNYNKDLTEAYKKNDAIFIEDYFDKESEQFKRVKDSIKDKKNKGNKYKVKEFEDININEDKEFVNMVVKTNINNRVMYLKYTLDLGYKNKYFKVKNVEIV